MTVGGNGAPLAVGDRPDQAFIAMGRSKRLSWMTGGLLGLALVVTGCSSRRSGGTGDAAALGADPPVEDAAAFGNDLAVAAPQADPSYPVEPADAPAARPDPPPADAAARVSDAAPQACALGAMCSGASTCARACAPGRAIRCQCVGGRFFCTGCEPADAGLPPDARPYPPCARNMNVNGRACLERGDVCDYATDAGARLCVCADLGRDREWVCQ